MAKQAGLDDDEALVTLWDAGLDEFDEPMDLVSRQQLRQVLLALGLTDGKEQFTVAYWLRRTELSRAELTERMAEHGVVLAPSVRRIPRNSLRKFRRAFGETVPLREEVVPAPPEQLPPLRWETIGRSRPQRYLTEEEVLAIHDVLEEDFALTNDPISPPGLRDEALLSMAVSRPLTAFGDRLKYETIEMAGGALFHSLVHNHAFHNGNKRTALVGLLAFLDENGVVLTCDQKALFQFTLRTAQHRLVPAHADELADREVLEISRWIRGHSRDIERRELPMKWVRLKQRLREFDCVCTPSGTVGNRLNLDREIVVKARFGREKRIRRSTQVGWAGDGTEADRNTVHKIRSDLWLDDEHDIDSATFYRDATLDAFIIDYRRILQRLAKL